MSDKEENGAAATSQQPLELAKQTRRITTYCCVPQCSNYAKDGISVHYFPKDQKLREKWIIALKMGKKIKSTDRVCQHHFLPSDYIPQVNSAAKPFLKKNTIPTQNLPIRMFDSVDASPKKRQKEARKYRAEARESAVGSGWVTKCKVSRLSV